VTRSEKIFDDVSTFHLAGIRRMIWTEKGLLGRLCGYDEGVAEAFCAVSLRRQVHKGKESVPRSRLMIRERFNRID
jgi:hypothetical protein